MTRLILLDRDGVINYDSPDYIKHADEWVAIPGSLDAIAALKRAGFLVAVCTNQAAIGRGILTPSGLDAIHGKMRQALADLGVSLDGVRHCPHHPDDHCRCRKPQPGMILETLRDLRVPADDAVYVGDQIRDVEAAAAAGVPAVLVRTGSGATVEAKARALGVRCVSDDLAAFARSLIEKGPC